MLCHGLPKRVRSAVGTSRSYGQRMNNPGTTNLASLTMPPSPQETSPLIVASPPRRTYDALAAGPSNDSPTDVISFGLDEHVTRTEKDQRRIPLERYTFVFFLFTFVLFLIICVALVLVLCVLLDQPGAGDNLAAFAGGNWPWVISVVVFGFFAGIVYLRMEHSHNDTNRRMEHSHNDTNRRMEHGQDLVQRQIQLLQTKMEQGQTETKQTLSSMISRFDRNYEANNMVVATTRLVQGFARDTISAATPVAAPAADASEGGRHQENN